MVVCCLGLVAIGNITAFEIPSSVRTSFSPLTVPLVSGFISQFAAVAARLAIALSAILSANACV